jgi:hypothetical protein
VSPLTPLPPERPSLLNESHLSVQTRALPCPGFWHTSVSVVYSNHTLGVNDAIRAYDHVTPIGLPEPSAPSGPLINDTLPGYCGKRFALLLRPIGHHN